jgi:uncharacterized protein YbjT (DUF2867 family)
MKINKPTIVVFGCTGTVGLEVMHLLSTKECFVRGILRSPDRNYPIPLNRQLSNISYLGVDLNSKAQIKQACIEADTVFLLTATAPNQIETETNIINAAKEAGITRIVKLSAPIVTPPAKVEVSDWHRQIEAHLDKSGLDYCCLRPHAFMQNWERNKFTIQRFGKIYGTMGDAPRNYVDCRDVAEIAVSKLLSENNLNKEYVPISGPEAITYKEFAERLSYVANHKIEYVNITQKELFNTLTKRAKLPSWLANHIVELDVLAINNPESNEDTVEKILNRKPRLINTYLQEAKQLFVKKPIWQFWD